MLSVLWETKQSSLLGISLKGECGARYRTFLYVLLALPATRMHHIIIVQVHLTARNNTHSEACISKRFVPSVSVIKKTSAYVISVVILSAQMTCSEAYIAPLALVS